MGILLTEQQLRELLSELDVASITKAAEEYGKSEEDSQKKFQDAISQAISGKPLQEVVLDESLIDYSLIFKILGNVLSPEQMDFMKASYEAMHYTSIDHLPIAKTGEIMLFIEYILYLAGLVSLRNKIKNAADFVKILPKLGYYLVGGIAKRINRGATPSEIVTDFFNSFKKNDEIIQESLVDTKKSNIFAQRIYTKRQIYETVSRINSGSKPSAS